MGNVVYLDEYRKKRELEELTSLEEELEFLIKEQISQEIEQLQYEYYTLTADEKRDIGLDSHAFACYVVISPWIFFTADDDFVN